MRTSRHGGVTLQMNLNLASISSMAKERTFTWSPLILALFSPLAMAQISPSAPNPSDLLERARTKLISDVSRQSRYTCVQNITRQIYQSHSKKRAGCANIGADKERARDVRLVSTDQLQLDVAIAENREIHSWPGAFRFAEDEIRDSVASGGPFGSGDFAAFIAGIFGGSARVKHIKSRMVSEHPVLEYAFEVPQVMSNYAISDSGRSFTTAYDGSFLLDQNGDLTQLTVRTAELPDVSNACHATSEIWYQRIDIRGQGVLIPRETKLDTIFRDGTQTDSTTSYSNCHEYTARSVMRFDIPDAASEKPRLQSVDSKEEGSGTLPDGLIFQCRIETVLNSDTQPGGVIHATLTTPLVAVTGEILAPLGAHIQGRLLRLAQYTNPHVYFEADVRLDTIEVNGNELPLYAVPARQDLGKQLSDFAITAPRNVGTFFFDQKHLNVRQWDSTWQTTFPPTRKDRRDGPDTQQNISDKDSLQNFVLALQYAQEATDLLNAKSGSLKDNANLPLILNYRQKAIELGRSVNLDSLNNLYPSLGDRFNSQFLSSLMLFVDSCNKQAGSESVAREELSRSVLLFGEWSNWYDPLRSAIDVALRSSAPNSPN